jgi:hypothetical protein
MLWMTLRSFVRLPQCRPLSFFKCVEWLILTNQRRSSFWEAKLTLFAVPLSSGRSSVARRALAPAGQLITSLPIIERNVDGLSILLKKRTNLLIIKNNLVFDRDALADFL